MPRGPRNVPGGFVYHLCNRGAGRAHIFHKDADYAAFERIMSEGSQRLPMRICAYCLMPNHWHMILWPLSDGDLSRWLRWVTNTHTQRYHAHYHTSGTGHIYQGRFKSFPIQSDPHLLIALRYVERNPLRAKLVPAPSTGIGQACGGEPTAWAWTSWATGRWNPHPIGWRLSTRPSRKWNCQHCGKVLNDPVHLARTSGRHERRNNSGWRRRCAPQGRPNKSHPAMPEALL